MIPPEDHSKQLLQHYNKWISATKQQCNILLYAAFQPNIEGLIEDIWANERSNKWFLYK